MDSISLELDHHHHTSFLITKGRRTKRQRSTTTTVTSTSSSHAGGGSSGGDGGPRSDNNYYSSSTATQPDHDFASHVIVTAEEEDMANCLILLAQGINRGRLANPTVTTTTSAVTATSVYECKTCNRSFPSFQALGGHRASHKKPKPNPIPAVSSPSDRDIVDDEDESKSTNHKTNNSTNIIRSNVINDVSKGMIMRVHECSICGSEFPSGQALGGHMRRHRAPPLPAPSPSDRPIRIGGGGPRIGLPPLDLNLPAPSDDHMETKFHVLPTPALVDCHY